MLLHFNADRRLARIAADAVHIEELAGVRDRPWRRTVTRADDTRCTGPGLSSEQDIGELTRRRALELAIEAAVVGDADQLHEVLTADAVGWSPTFEFRSRDAAEAAARELEAALDIVSFRVNRLVCTDWVAVAEWQAEASLRAPLLVADDVLIDASGRTVTLSGASIADLSGERISAIHTYFDEAALIEQVVLGSAPPPSRW